MFSDLKSWVRKNWVRSVNWINIEKCRNKEQIAWNVIPETSDCLQKVGRLFYHHSAYLLMWIIVFHYELHKIRCEKQTNWLDHCCLYSTNNNKIYAWFKNTFVIPLIFKFVNIIICTIGVVCYPVASRVKNIFIILLIFKFINRPVCTTVAVCNVCCYL
jgi:hypothetical protein